jgi:hypothetical protein
MFCAPAEAATSSSSSSLGTSNPTGDLSAAITQITGIAISPLLGIGAVGAVKYFRADAATRPKLPWFAQPWFFAPALLLVAVCFLKDTAGVAVPTALKKPLDLAEVFENKVSGLIATGAIVPIAYSAFQAFDKTTSSLDGSSFAAIDLSPVYNVLMVPVALAVYAVVWLVSHTINILILISPFSSVDAALKSFRTAILSSVVLSHWFSDTLGLLWAGVIILVCALLSGWAFRLLVYGNTIAWDLVSFHSRRLQFKGGSAVTFLARKWAGVPVRTRGKIERNAGGTLVFTYRPWLVLPVRSIELPAGRYAIGRGVLHPSLILLDGVEDSDVANFPPRFSSHESALAEVSGATEIRDTGIRAAWSWLKGCFGGNTTATA